MTLQQFLGISNEQFKAGFKKTEALIKHDAKVRLKSELKYQKLVFLEDKLKSYLDENLKGWKYNIRLYTEESSILFYRETRLSDSLTVKTINDHYLWSIKYSELNQIISKLNSL